MAPRRETERNRRDITSIAISVVIAGVILGAVMIVVPMIAAFY